MPEIGEIKRAGTIGYRGQNLYIWHACEGCGKERWVLLKFGKPTDIRCYNCGIKLRHTQGSNNPNWKGGRIKRNGYTNVWLSPSDFFYPMTDKTGYVREHRLVVAKALKRCLLPWEIVHHKKGYAKDDNRYPETLQLITDKRFHMVDVETKRLITQLKKQVKEQGKRITLLEAEIILLSQINKEEKWRTRFKL